MGFLKNLMQMAICIKNTEFCNDDFSVKNIMICNIRGIL